MKDKWGKDEAEGYMQRPEGQGLALREWVRFILHPSAFILIVPLPPSSIFCATLLPNLVKNSGGSQWQTKRTSVRIPFVLVRPNQAESTAVLHARVQAIRLNWIVTVATKNVAATFSF